MVDRTVLEAALRVRNMPEMAAFFTWLKKRSELARSSLVTMQDQPSMLRAQGRAQEIDEIIRFIEQSRDTLDRVADRTATRRP